MALGYTTPGVYTVERSVLPPTVAVLPSAIPVFIGYTQKAQKRKDESLINIPTRIRSLKEYVDWFGGAPSTKLEVDVDDSPANPFRPQVTVFPPGSYKYKMYNSLQFYYENGGGVCWIVSVGTYDDEPDGDVLKEAIGTLKKIKEITIILFPEGTSLEETVYGALITAALKHCEEVKNRVTIIDLHEENGEDITKVENGFQQNMPAESVYKRFGMCYYPFINTVFKYLFDAGDVMIRNHALGDLPEDVRTGLKTLKDPVADILGKIKTKENELLVLKKEKKVLDSLLKELEQYKVDGADPNDEQLREKYTSVSEGRGVPGSIDEAIKTNDSKPLDILRSALKEDTGYPSTIATKEGEIDADRAGLKEPLDKLLKGFRYTDPDTQRQVVYKDLTGLSLAVIDDPGNKAVTDLGQIAGRIKDAVAKLPLKLPPSGAIAGIYVRTDATRGVWKAPANTSVFGAVEPALIIDEAFHGELNSPPSGKAVNVIRSFPGRGVLVYGARTLDGNSLEWRYVNVRRTFSFIEASVANAMLDFVFEPNTPETWIKVKSMIKSFLNRLWKAGGLFGNTPEEAYDVQCEVPVTMSVEEMLAGIMRVFIKVAVARPAEFIELQYEHKVELPES